jgi:hypothetical protein
MAALAALSVIAFNHLYHYADSMHDRRVVIGEGLDALRFDRRGTALREVLDELRTHTTPAETLLVIPEGPMLNYLARMRNPTPYPGLMPIEMLKFDPDRVFAAIRRSPPDWLVAAQVPTEAFGSRSFQRDYGRHIWRWVEAHYIPVMTSGDRSFSMRLYQRIDAPTTKPRESE